MPLGRSQFHESRAQGQSPADWNVVFCLRGSSVFLSGSAALFRWKRFLLFISPTEIKSKRPNGCLCAPRAPVFVYPLSKLTPPCPPGPRAWYSILHTPSTSSAPQLNFDSDNHRPLWSHNTHQLCKLIDLEGRAKTTLRSFMAQFCSCHFCSFKIATFVVKRHFFITTMRNIFEMSHSYAAFSVFI